MYKVLWFDDEHATLETIKEDAQLLDIKLVGYANAVDGIEELKENYQDYDSVLLDGMFFVDDNSSGIAGNSKAFGMVAKFLSDLKAKGDIMPWFIYSGQKNFVKDKDVVWDVLKDEEFSKGKVFDKNSEPDFIQLCAGIKQHADKRPTTQIRHKYPECFKVFDLNILEKKHKHILVEILINYENRDYKKKNIPVQRDLLEAIFKSLNDVTCLPNEFFDDRLNRKPNQERCTLFLEGTNVSDRNTGESWRINKFIPREISAAFRILKENTNKNSHLGDDEILKNDFVTNTQMLINILFWLPEYVHTNYPNYI